MTFASGADLALASMAPPGGSGSSQVMMQLLFFGAIFAIFYFLMIRPQQKQRKQHEERLRSLKRNDEVVTVGGIIGKVVHADGNTLRQAYLDITNVMMIKPGQTYIPELDESYLHRGEAPVLAPGYASAFPLLDQGY